jgi:hypothetical protein
MKIITQLTVAIGLAATIHLAQAQPGGPGGPHGGGRPPTLPIMTALDANTNGVIEASEIANASTLLLTLDKNSDGKLSASELQPKSDSSFTHSDGTLSASELQPKSDSSFTPPGGRKMPTLPVMKALDTNSDGELDATEIANASTALKTLDTNGDGQLTRDEIMPAPPGGFGGNGGPPPENQ